MQLDKEDVKELTSLLKELLKQVAEDPEIGELQGKLAKNLFDGYLNAGFGMKTSVEFTKSVLRAGNNLKTN